MLSVVQTNPPPVTTKTAGTGLTSTVAVIAAPGQLLAVGVIVNVTVIGVLVVLVRVPVILPEPLAAVPVIVPVLSRVQLNEVPLTLPLRTIAVMAFAEQIVCDGGVATAFGVGLTTTVAVIAAPGQLLAVGVIVNVTVIGALVVLVNEPPILPEPLAAMPVTVAVLLRVQLNIVPLTLPLSTIAVMAFAEQIVCDGGVATAFGVGLTTTVAVIAVPGQLLAVGVIVNVSVIGALVVLVKVPVILPDPLAAMPVTVPVLSRVQLNAVPLTLPLRTIVVMAFAEQMVCEAGVATAFGVGLTSTVAVIAAPGQLLAVGVTVKVTVIGALVVLVKVPVISPDPLAAMPVTVPVLSRVQLNAVPLTLPLSAIVVMAFAEQMVCEARVATAFGVGLTSTVAVIAVPGQLLAVGVIVNVTVIGALVLLVSEPLMLPEPLAAMPVTVPVLSRVQLNAVPLTLPLSTIVVMAFTEQMVCEAGVATAFGVGLTSTVAVIGVPEQLLTVGVIVNITVIGALVVLVNEPVILPEPLVAMPVTTPVLSRVQLNAVPLTLPLSTIVVMAFAEQMVCEAGVATAFGVGLTEIVTDAEETQLLAFVTVTVYVAVVTGVTVIVVVEAPVLHE